MCTPVCCYARELEKKNYLEREKRVQTTNRFRLDPLFEAIEKLMAKQKAAAKHSPIRARGVLIQERLLEQIPGAREGTLRLTQRGLQVQLPSGASTVQSSVQ